MVQAGKKTLALKGRIPPSAVAVRRQLHVGLLQEHKEIKAARLKARAERRGEVLKQLCKLFSKCFSFKERKPLKVGIHHDILQAMGESIDPKELHGALRYYTGGLAYLKALAVGQPRVDLQGRAAGEVTAEERRIAQQEVERVEALLLTRPKPDRRDKPKPQPQRRAAGNAR